MIFIAISAAVVICIALFGLYHYNKSHANNKLEDTNTMMTIIYDNDFRCIAIKNPHPNIIFGVGNKDLVGTKISSISDTATSLNKEEAKVVARNISETVETGKSRYFEYTCRFDNGATHHALCYTSRDEDRTYAHIFEIKERNIYDLHQALSDSSINSTIENIAAGVYVREYDTQGNEYIFVNNIANKYYCTQELLSSPYWDQKTDDYYDNLVITKDVPVTFELTHTDSSGKKNYLKVVKTKANGKYGAFNIVTTLIDHTQQVESDKELRDAHANLELVLDSAKETVWEYTIEKDRFETIYGLMYSNGNTSLNDYTKYIGADQRDEVLEVFNSLIEGRVDRATLNNHFYDSETNSDYFYDSSLLLKRDEDGNPTKILGTFNDVSNQIFDKKKQEELAYRYSTIFHSIEVGIGVRDTNGQLIDFNAKFLECYGVENVDEFLKVNTDINTTIIPEAIYNDYVNKKSNKHIVHYNYDKVNYKTNKTGIAIFEVIVNPMVDGKGKFVGFVTLISEITERYNAQKEIAEARANLDLALQAGGVAAWIYDVNSDTFHTLHGEAIAGEGITMSENNKILHPDDIEVQGNIFALLLSGEQEQAKAIFRYNTADNEYSPYESQMVVKRNAEGVVTHIMGTQKDLSDELRKNRELSRTIRKNEYIMSNINSGVVYIDSEYNVLWGNVSEFMKLSVDSSIKPYATGSICYESLGKDEPCEDCLLQKALKSGKLESKELEIFEGQFVEVFASPVQGETEYNDGTIIRIDEITERKNLYSQLELSRNNAEEANVLMNNIFDKLPCLLFIKDITDDYRYILANDYFCRSTGYASENLIGHTDFELFEPEVARKFRIDDEGVVSSGELFSCEEEVLWCGVLSTWQTSKYVIEARNGHKMLVGLSLDLTEKINMIKDLEKEKNRAEESDQLKSAFLANMSHEIRTPLNAIVGFSELIQDSTDADEKQEFMQIINTNNDLLLGLINDILDLSKIEAGMIELVRSPFDLVPFFAEFGMSLKQKVKNPNVEFIIENPFERCILNLDRNRLAQIVTNFATNAIKFTQQGYIKMGYEYVDNGVRVYVEDTGIGIPKEKHDKVFVRFEKLNSFTQGTGLGLSICSAIINASGGKIGFVSEEGVGSTFWAWIKCDIEPE